MIDGTILSIIPPLIAAVLTYLIANKRARLAHAKLFADMQASAIEQVSNSEEKMRKELWIELDKLRAENQELRKQIDGQRESIDQLEEKLKTSENLVTTLTNQVGTLTGLVNTYKNRIIELENQKHV
jgi:peptidoglycan hydrolase CwlO-like protein